MKNVFQLLLLTASLTLSAACGASDGSGSDGGDSCSGGETRCSGDAYQECRSGKFKDTNICAGSTTCSESLGCVECRPEDARACVGDVVHICRDDGSIGDARETCGVGQCSGGSCGGGGADRETQTPSCHLSVLAAGTPLLRSRTLQRSRPPESPRHSRIGRHDSDQAPRV